MEGIEFWQLTDTALVTLIAQDNSKSALSELYERYFGKLVHFAHRYLGNVQHSEDVVQDCFIKLIAASKTFDPHKTFSTWMYTIVRNSAINAAKQATQRERLYMQFFDTSATTHQVHNIDADNLRKDLFQILSGLSEKEQLIYELRVNQQLSLKEVASISNIAEGSVKSCLYYLLKKISDQLKHTHYVPHP
jgi:RNA polymerase sigma-70 factor, ECF subfamily